MIQITPDGVPHVVRKGIILTAPLTAAAPPAREDPSVLPRGPYQVNPPRPSALPGFGGGRSGGSSSSESAPIAGMGGGGGMSGMPANPAAAPANTTQSVEDPAARQANADVMNKLAKSHTADFHANLLREALSYIADGSGIDVVVDERAISEIGVDVNSQPVTLHVGSKPMEQILSLTLRLANPQLDYSIYNGVVFVSSHEALNRRIVTRIYDLPSSVDHDAMVQMVSDAVDSAKCNFFEQKIVVTAPEVSQRDVARLLAQITPPQLSGAPQSGTPQSGAQQSGTPQSGTPQSGTPQSGVPQSGQQPVGTRAMFLFKLRTAKASEVAAQFPKELGDATADDRTNSVLITTPQLDAAKDVVAKLDGGQPSNFAHSESVVTPVNSSVTQLSDALAMYKTMYGSDNPRVKQLEQQLAAMRLRAASNVPVESAPGR